MAASNRMRPDVVCLLSVEGARTCPGLRQTTRRARATLAGHANGAPRVNNIRAHEDDVHEARRRALFVRECACLRACL